MVGSITNDQGETFTPNLVDGMHGLDDVSDLLHVVLRNDWAADPYGIAMSVMACALAQALENKGTMNETEYHNLMIVEEVIRSRDNS
jgi:hypothetical protein